MDTHVSVLPRGLARLLFRGRSARPRRLRIQNTDTGGTTEMRTKAAIATFVALGATSAGVSALNNAPSTRGSDTLNGITDRVIGICESNLAAPRIVPAGSIVYDGTGSGNGQANIAATAILTVDGTGAVTETAIQTIAPMSRSM